MEFPFRRFLEIFNFCSFASRELSTSEEKKANRSAKIQLDSSENFAFLTR